MSGRVGGIVRKSVIFAAELFTACLSLCIYEVCCLNEEARSIPRPRLPLYLPRIYALCVVFMEDVACHVLAEGVAGGALCPD